MIKLKIVGRLIQLFVLVLLFQGCDSGRVYDNYEDFDALFWHIDSVQLHQFEIDDATSNYVISASFRNTSSYPYHNLFFQYTIEDSSKNIISQELKEVNLFDPTTGKPNGSGLGDLFDHRFVLEEKFSFPSSGRYNLNLQQFMRVDSLAFLISVGARVEKIAD